MRLITLLNHCQHFPGFVYELGRWRGPIKGLNYL